MAKRVRPAKKRKVKGSLLSCAQDLLAFLSAPNFTKFNQNHDFNSQNWVDKDSQDWISQLPDEILVYILSLLTLKEAARTCVLSHRWEKLWTLSPNLYFEEKKILDDIEFGRKSLATERLRYKSWVNQVVKLYQGAAAVDEFRIHFYLDRDSQQDIDRWVNFAMSKKVKRLEMDLSDYLHCSFGNQYFFPDKQVKKEWLSQSIGFPMCNSLTALFLRNVSVSGEVVEYFLSNCPFLERLYVSLSDSLVSLQVSGLSLPLKYLEIHNCLSLRKIDLCAPNITSFKYSGKKISIPFKFDPTLKELSIAGDCSEDVVHDLCVPSSYLSQLETISLDLPHEIKFECTDISVLGNLKQLKLKVCADGSHLSIIPLIEACPFLHSFSLEVEYWDFYAEKRARKPNKRPHQYLKVVEFVGFRGKAFEVEIAMYIIENAVMLDKIIFDTRIQVFVGGPFECQNPKERRKGKKRARCFKSKVRPEADVVIL